MNIDFELVRNGTFEQLWDAIVDNRFTSTTYSLALMNEHKLDLALQLHDRYYLDTEDNHQRAVAESDFLLFHALVNEHKILRILLDRGYVYTKRYDDPKSLLEAVVCNQPHQLKKWQYTAYGGLMNEERGIEDRLATLHLLLERGELEKERIPETLLVTSLNCGHLPLTLALLDAGVDPDKTFGEYPKLSFKRYIQTSLGAVKFPGNNDDRINVANAIRILNHIRCGPTLFSIMIKRVNF